MTRTDPMVRRKVRFCNRCMTPVAHDIYPSVGCIVTRCIQCRGVSKATGSYVNPGGVSAIGVRP